MDQVISIGRNEAMNRSFFYGAAAAAGVVMLIPGVAVALGRAGQPLARATARTGAVAVREFRKAAAEVYEHMEDLAAEFEAEVARPPEDAEPAAERDIHVAEAEAASGDD
ncbi:MULTISPECIES: DUF5132 domain-containing protein [unclassified Roseitalea]|uniref:DUF5132 domain-containing protein n=1 Tax=unclassified Roseitalea TaxID=2639107 RepID=UPI00273F9A3C|nr:MULTISPECIES: DUF5132 domain-containing protein [unclassified Roseitalea]